MFKVEKEERQLLASVERGEWRSTRPTSRELRRYATYARQALRKDRRINIRLSQVDLEGLQGKALQEGIPYQTLISSILHKYASGQLKAA